MNANRNPSAPRPDCPPVAAPPRLLAGDTRSTVKRLHAGVLIFYLVDALLLTAYGAVGVVSPHIGWMFAAAGCSGAAAMFYGFWQRGGRVDELDEQGLFQAVLASALMLAAMGLAPRVSGLMLMNIVALLALSAMTLRRPHLLGLCLMLGGGSTWVLCLTGGAQQIPTGSTVERSLTGVWLVWVMWKASAHNATGRKLRELVSQSNSKLAEALSELEKLASTDDLSNLPNRRSILNQLTQALDRQSDCHRVGVALLDIDNFKSVNDRFGHAIGDQVLRVFSERISQSLRTTDRLGRYGGEEFLLVLQQLADDRSAWDAAERVCRQVEAEDWGRIATGLVVTVSAGVAVMRPGETGVDAIRRADAALYEAKRRGRNQVRCHEELAEMG